MIYQGSKKILFSVKIKNYFPKLADSQMISPVIFVYLGKTSNNDVGIRA